MSRFNKTSKRLADILKPPSRAMNLDLSPAIAALEDAACTGYSSRRITPNGFEFDINNDGVRTTLVVEYVKQKPRAGWVDTGKLEEGSSSLSPSLSNGPEQSES
jgi:hypothetical protein